MLGDGGLGDVAALVAAHVDVDETDTDVVDPAVVGGVRVSVRDLVIDSTVRSSIAELRTALAG